MTEYKKYHLEGDCREIAMNARTVVAHRTREAGDGRTACAGYADIMAEVEKATTKFPTWPTDPLHALAVLGEEYGELLKETVQATYEPHKSDRAAVRREAIQTAAMAVRFLMSLNAYEYTRGAQHEQRRGCAACDRGDHQLGHAEGCPHTALISRRIPAE